MHLTLKQEATKPAAANVPQQQARRDDFITCYNQERPHQGLGMKVPADLYSRSPRSYRGLEELTYPFHDATYSRKVNLSHVFAGQNVGVTQVGERIWLVTFMRYDLGYFDDETCRLEPIEREPVWTETVASPLRKDPREGWLAALDDFRNWLIREAA
jgi:putative transposase